jgi:hypothetical protein
MLHRGDGRATPGAGALALAAVIAAALGVAGCGGGSTTSSSQATDHASAGRSSGGISSAEKRAARHRLAKELGVSKARVKRLGRGHGLPATSVRPGEIVPGGPGPFFSSDTIYPVINGWQASDHRSYTGVDAGANPANRSVGELGIFRQDYTKVTQTQHVVNVPGAGALRIVAAPTGGSVATWAQKRGNLQFVGKRGVRGTLHLSNDNVTIQQRPSAPQA